MGHGRDQRPHVELYLSVPVNMHCVLALVGTGAECSMIYCNPKGFTGTPPPYGLQGEAWWNKPRSLGNRVFNTVCDVILMSDYLTDKCGSFARSFGSCRLLETVYSALSTNSIAIVRFGMKGHQVELA